MQTYRHRDWQSRVTTGPYTDRYIHHYDGRLRKLIVACTDNIFEGPDTSTWRRTYVRKVSPLKVRLATWVIDFTYEPESWGDWGIMLLRAFPAALALQFVVRSHRPYRILNPPLTMSPSPGRVSRKDGNSGAVTLP